MCVCVRTSEKKIRAKLLINASIYNQASMVSTLNVHIRFKITLFISVQISIIQCHHHTQVAVLPPAENPSPCASPHSSISPLSRFSTPSLLQRSKLKAHACPKINLDEGIKLKAKPQEFYYVLMLEPLTWIILVKYE